ncbi:MAG: TRAP transporter fused permease subunit [Deltaproteobacteria bacterium]|nr:TRAP transporter fused permease subunit [Deltaproteobacteria bacterium]
MQSFVRIGLSVTSALLALLVAAFAWTLWTTQAHYSVIFLALSFLICSLTVLQKKGDAGGFRNIALKAGPFLLMFISIIASIYFFTEYEELLFRAGAFETIDLAFSVLILIPLMALIWKEGGSILTFLVLLFLGYSAYGNYLPGLLFHKGLSYDRILEMLVLNFEGIYGFVIQVVGTWVAIFVIYAGLIQGFGAFDVIMKICIQFARKHKWALPQIPVSTSLIFGMFSGAAAANVAGTGSFTIPLLKKFGFPPYFAGAIESTASTGGQIMPPIMGATAFLMAALLGESYMKIMLIGFIPALIFFVSVAFSVHLLSHKYLVVPEGSELGEEVSLTRQDLFKLLPMAVSLCVLLLAATYFLIPLMKAALYAILCLLAGELVYLLVVSRSTLVRDFWGGILNGVKKGALPAASIGIVGAAMGIIVKTMTVTTLAPKLSFLMVDLAAGFFPLLILLILVVSLLFGCMVATLAVYIMVVFLAASALQEFGIPLFVTHFMIFYFSGAAMITPPVAPAALVAAGIAGTGFMRTGWEAMKLGLSFLTLPLAFVNYPDLLIMGSSTIPAIMLVTIAHLLISYGFYASLHGFVGTIGRTLFAVAGGTILFCPMRIVNSVVAVLFGAALVYLYLKGSHSQKEV